MPTNLVEQLYCSEQIHIPPAFPWVMKLYCKAAIKTQPYDLLRWSAAYFRAMAKGEEPPVKLGKDPETEVTVQLLFQKWYGVCLQDLELIKLVALLGAHTSVNWLRFLAVACGTLCSCLTQTMILICEILTEEPEGGMATIPFEIFMDLYTFLAYMDCGPMSEDDILWAENFATTQDIEAIAARIREGDYGLRAESVLLPKEEEEEMAPEEEQAEPEELVLELPCEEEETEVRSVDLEAAELKGEGGEGGEAEGEKSDEEEEKKEEEEKEAVAEPAEAPADAEAAPADGDEKKEEGDKEEEKKAEEVEPEPAGSDESVPGEGEAVGEGEELGEHEEPEPSRGAAPGELVELKLLKPKEVAEPEPAEVEELGEEEAGLIGFMVFRVFLRQDVPGIGPPICSEAVAKVYDFMEYWAGKQEMMVAPRNIRHWMCPPLDKVCEPEIPKVIVPTKRICHPPPAPPKVESVPSLYRRPCARPIYRKPCKDRVTPKPETPPTPPKRPCRDD